MGGQAGSMRAAITSSAAVGGRVMTVRAPGVKFDVEGSGYGFRVMKTIAATAAEQPTTCRMQRPL